MRQIILLLPVLLLPLLSLLPAEELKLARPSAKHAQSSHLEQRLISGPIVGYSVHPAQREARVILGVPGATHYSEPAAWPDGADAVHTTPGHGWLLVLSASDTGAAASAWSPELHTERTLGKVEGTPSLISISPSGAAAAFYWQETRRLVVYSGLPALPVLAAEVVNESWSGNWTSIAVSGDGRLVAGASELGELRLLLRDGRPAETLVREAHALASFGFFGGDNMLAVAEAGSDRVELIGGVREEWFTRRLVQLPAAASLSARLVPGGRDWFSLIDPEAPAIHRLELAGGVRSFGLEGIPVVGVESLRPQGAALLRAPDGEAPRIVLTHAVGDELYYLPTFAGLTVTAVEEEGKDENL